MAAHEKPHNKLTYYNLLCEFYISISTHIPVKLQLIK